MANDLAWHYGSGPAENTRLSRTPHGRLEFLRTQELLRQVLATPTRVLDVGGGTGVHAEWLARDGHSVHLIDVVPAHVDAAATLPGVTAEVGDARQLPTDDNSVDTATIASGHYDGRVGFTPTHWHTADELRAEIRAAGLADVTVYGVEGPAWPALDAAGASEFAARVDAALPCARLADQDPLLINTSAHFLAIAR
ncbi:MAG TPA: methyltransferase domain-containing protein [Pseudonocardiaceae bacterium]|jgi:SAM-dependent methyltransferase|nr:methyltransferase domain-containing protein [Pseudonocardiaceae bacterium]